jgi:SAM-dependent methyltransferase
VIKESLDTKILSNLYKKRANVEVKHIFANHSSISFCGCKSCGLLFYYPIILGDGKFYEDLQSYPGYYLEEKEDYTIACKYITASDDVLEVGCGAGFFTNFIKPKSYVGLEFNDKAIGLAKGKGLDVRKQFLQEHAQENAEKYDVVCFFQVLEHIEDPRAFITDALKCLKKGSKLILAVPAEDSHNADAVNAYLNMPPHHATRWSDATLKNIASLFNIQLVDIIHENIQPIHEKVKDFKKGSRYLQKINYIGLDMQQTGHNHSFSEVDVFYDEKKIPFEAETFDAVFSGEVFEHIFNLEEMLDELHRVLKKDGKMLITVPFIWGEHERPYDFARYTSFGIKDILEKKGFRVITSEKTGKASESILQLYTAYLHNFFPNNRVAKVILTFVFIFPIHFIGGIFTLILPKNKDIYFNNVVLVQK